MSGTKWLQDYVIDKGKIKSELANTNDEDILVANWMDIVRRVKLDYVVFTGFRPDKDEAATIIVLDEDYEKDDLESNFP